MVAAHRPLSFLVGLLLCSASAAPLPAQRTADTSSQPAPPPAADQLTAPQGRVDVQPVARDEQIRQRLQSVLTATGWFTRPGVDVREGVAFLSGQAQTEKLRAWAGDLAANTQGVVAVVNRIAVPAPSAWDFSAARSGLAKLWHDLIRALPLFVLGLIILGLSAVAGWLAALRARKSLATRVRANLLRNVLAWAIGVMVFLVGTYVVLRVSGLTQLALTLVGGTGLIGLALGLAFRDISENFLASLFLSIQRPFKTGDLIEVAGSTGYVQQLNVRTTVLMTLDGNLVQVPNAMVYKSPLCNFTSNANRRESFVVGIGYDNPIDEAQEVARQVLASHPAVLKDPEPWVLADDLGNATVNLKIYFWLDGNAHSWLKVRSSVIRLVKRAFQAHGITMPDAAREVLFPQGVPVRMVKETEPTEGAGDTPATRPPSLVTDSPSDAGAKRGAGKANEVSTRAEGGLSSEAGALEEQARQATPLAGTQNLLESSDQPGR